MSGTGARVLVVDDQSEIAEVVRMLLEERGARVRLAGTGEAALAALRSSGADVVIVDLSLPDVEGTEVARRIRAEHGAGVRLVAFTGFEGAEVRQRCLDAGFDDFVVKPYDLAELERVLDGLAVLARP